MVISCCRTHVCVYGYPSLAESFNTSSFVTIRGGFLIRRSSAIRRFIAGFLTCDNRTIMKLFLKKIAREFTGNLHKNPPKFPENSRAIFFEKRLHYCTIIARQKSCDKPANRRAASDEKPTPGVTLGVNQL